MTNYENNIIDAIEKIVNNTVANTGYNKTMLGIAKKLEADYIITPECDEVYKTVENNILYSSSAFKL